VSAPRQRRLGLALGLALGLLPATGRALEPRFDHRDQQGLLAELNLARDSEVVKGLTEPTGRLALRLAWGFDLSGEGDELQVGGSVRLGSWYDPQRTHVLATIDTRYRAYFGSEELKTFVEIGLWSCLASRLALGALGGVGLAYDPSRAWGVYLSAQFNGGFGEARITSVGINTGIQLRW
jgi:hypothetical protein